MTKDNESNRSWPQWISATILAAILSFNGWTATKVISLDKELVKLKSEVVSNKEMCIKSEEKLEQMFVEQRAMHVDVVKIATKLGVDVD